MNKNRKISVLIAILMALSALAGVSATGSDPLDPSDGGEDWDGDGLTNAEEQAARLAGHQPRTLWLRR